MDLSFTPISQDDVGLTLKYMEALYADIDLKFDSNLAEFAIAELLLNDTYGEILLIRDAGEPVGYVALTYGFSMVFGGYTVTIDELFVREDARRRGIGSRTLEFVIERSVVQGYFAMYLEVARTNLEAKRLYERLGFREHESYLMSQRLIYFDEASEEQ